MSILIGAEDLSLAWPAKELISHQSVAVNEGDRIGIVGPNGAGKSTLLAALAKRVEPEGGQVIWRNNISVGLLGQDDSFEAGEEALHAVVGDRPQFEWASDARIREVLDALMDDIAPDAQIGALSGGQRRRVDLARVLVQSWDALMLDEPTNHLDMATIHWLAAYLRRRVHGSGALLVVTHDRWFLDEVCEQMWEVHDQLIEPFEGGYSAYIQQRVERERLRELQETKRQNALRRELSWLARGPKARSSKPRFRVEAARALVADDPPLRDTVELKRLAVARLGKQVIELDDVSEALGGRPVLTDVNLNVGPGDRVGIVGTNGAGKTTLLRLMAGDLAPSEGRVKIGKTVRFGVLSQRLDVLADKGSWSVRELVESYKRMAQVEGKLTSAADLLERLGFKGSELESPIDSLSGGQRRRLALLCVLLEEPNVLILDEPGNDLDTDMLAVLESLLDEWPGTLVLVTHDRYLMERVCDDEYCLIDGQLRHLPGGIDEYFELLDECRGKTNTRSSSTAASETPAAGSGMSNSERQAAKRRQEALSRKLEKLSARPDELRDEMAAADPSDYLALEELQSQLNEVEAEISALEDEWLTLAEALGE